MALSTAQGLFTAATAAGSVLGMPLWGALYRRAGGEATFAAASLVSGAAFALALLWARRVRSGVPLCVPEVAPDRGLLGRTP